MVLAGLLAGTFGFWLSRLGYGSGRAAAALGALPARVTLSFALPRLGRGYGGCLSPLPVHDEALWDLVHFVGGLQHY